MVCIGAWILFTVQWVQVPVAEATALHVLVENSVITFSQALNNTIVVMSGEVWKM